MRLLDAAGALGAGAGSGTGAGGAPPVAGDGFGESRAGVRSWAVTTLGSNPYAGGVGGDALARSASGRQLARKGFAPIKLGTMAEMKPATAEGAEGGGGGGGDPTAAAEEEELPAEAAPPPAPPTAVVEVANPLVAAAAASEEETPVAVPAPVPAGAMMAAPQSRRGSVAEAAAAAPTRRGSIADWIMSSPGSSGGFTGGPEAAVPGAPPPARAPALSVVQQLCELVVPGSVSLGMGLGDTIPEPAAGSHLRFSSRDEAPAAPAPAPAPAARPAGPATFDVASVRTRREVVERQVVQLRRVENVRGDVVRAAPGAFTVVTGRTVIEETREGGKKIFGGI